MPARGPIFYKGGYYHIYSRGVEKRTVFQDNADYRRFLNKLKFYSEKYAINILAYCLMPNHYHLLITQNGESSAALFLQRLNLAYSMYFNKRYERVGPLFQGRFKAKLVKTDEYLLHLSRYIHLNPAEVQIKKKNLADYKWSSYPAYMGLRENDRITDIKLIINYFSKAGRAESYKKFVEAEQEALADLDDLGIDGDLS
jgi:REP element-mobilizing transposase RayT